MLPAIDEFGGYSSRMRLLGQEMKNSQNLRNVETTRNLFTISDCDSFDSEKSGKRSSEKIEKESAKIENGGC
jgi:hypothetical protein